MGRAPGAGGAALSAGRVARLNKAWEGQCCLQMDMRRWARGGPSACRLRGCPWWVGEIYVTCSVDASLMNT